MTLWIIILWTVMALLGLALFYLGSRLPYFFNVDVFTHWSKIKTFLVCACSVIGFMGIITLCLDFVNAIICTLYFAMIWMVSDAVFWGIQKFLGISFQHYYAGYIAIIISILSLFAGWYLNHHVWITKYTLNTSKEISPLRIILFADSHMGTSFAVEGFKKHLNTIQKMNPDIVVVTGDYVDDGTTQKEMILATKALGQLKTKYGVYFVFGNHDKGYYGSERRGFSGDDLVNELKKNGIYVLRDETVLINNDFYVIGRRDLSEVTEQRKKRTSMADLVAPLDKNKYMIVLDHQPADYKNQEKVGVDLVLSGHTHGGQLFPLNQVGKWIGANDLIYGHERRGKTDFIVTSGISSWAIQFKTGTKSEFVVIDVKHTE